MPQPQPGTYLTYRSEYGLEHRTLDSVNWRWTGTTLNVNSFMGIIMMVGIVVSNGVLLIDFARVLRERGRPLVEATVEAGKTRLADHKLDLIDAMVMAADVLAGNDQDCMAWIRANRDPEADGGARERRAGGRRRAQ